MRFDMTPYLRVFTSRSIAVMLLLGFSSGLPLALTGGTLQAWMTVSGMDIRTIGIFALIGLPYTLKFLWAPLMDHFVPPFFGRRRGWIMITQIALMAGIAAMGFSNPKSAVLSVAVLALAVAFSSASQDIVVDAYRTDVLLESERGMGAAVFVMGYRVATLASGALALIMSDNIGWSQTYIIMACLMMVGIAAASWGREPQRAARPPRSIKEAVVGPLEDFLSRGSALMLLLLIVLYKLGDAYAGSLTTAFLIRGAGFSPTDVGAINKGFGFVASIAGALIGGALMIRMRLFRALMAFGILQAASNLSFMVLAWSGKNYAVMIFAVAFENITGGMGTSAFVALLMALCNQRYSATQYALLSSLAAVGRIFIAPSAGFMVEAFGWASFFLITSFTAVPGLWMVWLLRREISDLHEKAVLDFKE